MKALTSLTRTGGLSSIYRDIIPALTTEDGSGEANMILEILLDPSLYIHIGSEVVTCRMPLIVRR